MSKKTEEFYHIFRYCIPSDAESAKKENDILENIINMSNKELTDYIRRHITKFTYYKKNYLDYKTAVSISEILVEIAFILRIQYLDYLKKKENNTLDNSDEEIINLSKMLQILISEMSMLIYNQEYETYNMFDTIKLFYDDTTIGHVNRVFLMTIEAISFFNEKLKQGAAGKLRIGFKKVYYKYSKRIYERFNLINKLDSLDSNVKLGIRKIENSTIAETAVGVLMHDISLKNDRDYIPIDNEEKDNHSIKDYAFAKYFMRGNKGVALTVALHHEYYSYGYGLFTELYRATMKRNPQHEIEYIMSYDYKDILTLQSLTYLPAKILEVIDVYDTLTKSIGKSEKEAVQYMIEDFLNKETMLDPIMLDIFIRYLNEKKKIRL